MNTAKKSKQNKETFANISALSLKDVNDRLCEEKELQMRLRFLRKMTDAKGYEARESRKRVARLKTALSLKKIQRGF
jgi:ribosomal protein L29